MFLCTPRIHGVRRVLDDEQSLGYSDSGSVLFVMQYCANSDYSRYEKPIPRGEVHCPECGPGNRIFTTQAEPIKCPNCNEFNERNATGCWNCQHTF